MVVDLIGPAGKSQKLIACLDTGADSCLFPLSFATLIGLDPLQMPFNMTRGVGSTNTTYYAEIDIQINGPALPISFRSMVGFTEGMEAQGMGLLGQSGFFENFPTFFNLKNKTFHIEV